MRAVSYVAPIRTTLLLARGTAAPREQGAVPMPSGARLLLRLLVCCFAATAVVAAPPQKLAIAAAAEGKVGKLRCITGSILIVTAQYGV